MKEFEKRVLRKCCERLVNAESEASRKGISYSQEIEEQAEIIRNDLYALLKRG